MSPHSQTWKKPESRRCEAKRRSYKHRLLALQQENDRLNALMNQMRSASESMHIENLGSAQQLQTSKVELSGAETEVSHL